MWKFLGQHIVSNVTKLASIQQFVILFILNIFAGSVSAQTTSANTGPWNTAANWSPAAVPPSANTVTINSPHNITVGSAVARTGTVTVAGGTLTFTTFNMSAGAVTLSSWTIAGGTGTLTGTSYDVQAGSVSAILAGTGSLTKTTTGTVILSGSNTYSGNVTVGAGILNIRNSAALGTTAGSTTVSSGATLQLQGGISVGAEPLTISGAGVASGGALNNVSGNNTYGGLVTLGADAVINSDAGTLTLSGGVAGAFDLTVNGSGDHLISGPISTLTSVSKAGRGTLTISGTATYPGSTTITMGTVELGAANRLPATPIVLGGGVLSTGATTGFSETVGTLALTCNSYINLGTGVHTLAFANSSAVGWTAGTKLIINGWTGTWPPAAVTSSGGKVNVGVGGLSASQLSQVQFFNAATAVYYTAAINGSGDLVPAAIITTQVCPPSLPAQPACFVGTQLNSGSLNSGNQTYYVASSSNVVISGWTLANSSGTSVINVCSGSVLNLNAWPGANGTANVVVNILSGGTLILGNFTNVNLGNLNVYGKFVTSGGVSIQNGVTVSVASSGVVNATAGNFDLTGSSAILRNEGSIFAKSMDIQGSGSKLCMANGACTHVQNAFNNNQPSTVDVDASGFLYLLQTGSQTFNKGVSTDPDLTVCKATASDYCYLNASGCNSCGPSLNCTSCGSSNQNPWQNATEANIGAGVCTATPAKCNLALSIHLAYFKANLTAEGVRVKWATTSQVKTAKFIIEKSSDGLTWEELDQVEVYEAANGLQEYATFDYTPYPGYTYYRLKEVETTGKISVEAVDMVEYHASQTLFTVYPNPSAGVLNVSVMGDFTGYSFELYDLSGHLLIKQRIPNGQTLITSDLDPGIYVAKLKLGPESKTVKLVVQ